MEELHRLDLTYITERIISLSCPCEGREDTYLRNLQDIVHMLQSKHGHDYMLINLSQKKYIFTHLHHRILDTGWFETLAPQLDQIFSVCRTMENWLQTNPKHILVLHCRGNKGLLGVLVASYIHYSNLTASADLSLDHFAMRRFYTDKLSALMTPSQKRYVWMVGSTLKGGLRMNPSPSFLLCVVLHGLPKTSSGGCCLFLRVYQSLQAVCTSAVYHVTAGHTDRLYFELQPAQLLKGDIMVVCYDKNSSPACRQVVFRLQFHTGLVQGHNLTFLKTDLDRAREDPEFPEDGKVELFFSESPEKITGRELWNNSSSVTVDYDTLDPLVRRDSYQQPSSPDAAPTQVLASGNESVYARVREKSSEEGASFSLTISSPSCSDRTLSASTDSGLSVASQGRTTGTRRRASQQDKHTRAGKPLPGLDFEIAQPLLEVMAELAARGGVEVKVDGDESGLGLTINGEASSSERETDILDDEDEENGEEPSGLEVPSLSSGCSLSSENEPESHRGVQPEYSTHSWVKQQQVVVVSDGYHEVDGKQKLRRERPPPLVAPDTPVRGVSSREAVQRGQSVHEDSVHGLTEVSQDSPSPRTKASSSQREDDLSSLNTDIDESIEQLNQLILDLDPTFVPVPTRCAPLSRSASLHTNGLSHKGNSHLSGWRQQKQISDITDYTAPLHSPSWRSGRAQIFRGSPAYSPSYSPSSGYLYKANSVDGHGLVDGQDVVPQTPAFPVSPPTPYDARSFLESMNHGGGGGGGGVGGGGGSTEGDLFRPDVSLNPASCQRVFGSMRSVSSGSPLSRTDSTTPPPVWHDRTHNSLNSPYPPQPSPPLSLSSPNAHSSPRGALKKTSERRNTDSTDLSSLLGNNGLDHSLLEAMEGLGGLNLGGEPAPLLPEKRRWGEMGDVGSRSPSVSGFSSPHSGSSMSIPFSSSVSSDPLRGLGGAPSPGAESLNKQDTVKFVQDTSKFWYKPDISRDQAITVLKDKEPGSFVVRDSHSFRGAYGLAMKVATPPPSVVHQSKKAGDLSNELVRHFLIECTPKGVRLKGCPNEPYFGSLTALVCQHSITPLALPCKLILPDKDPLVEMNDSSAQTATNSAAELLKQGAACNVWYLGSVELESLTGHQAVQKATTVTLSMDPPPASTVVHFKVSAQGITLTDNQRKLFFRRHYAVNTVIFCSLDPQGRKWTRGSGSTAKIFGFVARKSQSETENVCHLFAEHDPEQPASAIVNFVSKVMIGSHKK